MEKLETILGQLVVYLETEIATDFDRAELCEEFEAFLSALIKGE